MASCLVSPPSKIIKTMTGQVKNVEGITYSLAWNIQWLLLWSTDKLSYQWNACYQMKTETESRWTFSNFTSRDNIRKIPKNDWIKF